MEIYGIVKRLACFDNPYQRQQQGKRAQRANACRRNDVFVY